MPVFLLSMLGGLATVAGSLVGRVLLSLGIGYVSYKGINALLDLLKSQVVANVTGSGVEFVQALYLVKFDICVSIVFSAMAARLLIQGLTSDTITKMVLQ